ncbi:hypothetical protein [Falsiroseomonas tokyonensis]|uniref:DUF4142 domain-containing protein n=1 Tax=Falsiroseomonas tokyonensis TaxID=430521 RepID=A0ABV7BM18_9PROT|nr:hypothetical protein [Falsiroseomonas tokyonensis]MBU8536613.1 hypothetical protein [Falsiroseomonas tokyonensis]
MKVHQEGHPAVTSRRSHLQFVSLPLTLACWLAAGPAAAQWRTGKVAEPAPVLESRRGKLAGYAAMLDAAAERLHASMMALVAYGTRDPQRGSVPPQQQALVDQAQRAWLVVKNTPEDFALNDIYTAVDRQFAESVGRMQRAATAPSEAVAEARSILTAMERLEDAAAAAAMAAGPAP